MSEDVQFLVMVGLFMVMMLVCGIFIGAKLEVIRRDRQRLQLRNILERSL